MKIPTVAEQSRLNRLQWADIFKTKSLSRVNHWQRQFPELSGAEKQESLNTASTLLLAAGRRIHNKKDWESIKSARLSVKEALIELNTACPNKQQHPLYARYQKYWELLKQKHLMSLLPVEYQEKPEMIALSEQAQNRIQLLQIEKLVEKIGCSFSLKTEKGTCDIWTTNVITIEGFPRSGQKWEFTFYDIPSLKPVFTRREKGTLCESKKFESTQQILNFLIDRLYSLT